MTTTHLPASDVDRYDYLIVGGGTAGCVIASRLAEYLPHMKILVVEAGPSDFKDDRVLYLKDWLSLLGGELDYDYPTTEQSMGMISLSSVPEQSSCPIFLDHNSHSHVVAFGPFLISLLVSFYFCLH
jgi:hypothetical protein